MDPADTHWWVASLLHAIRPPQPREGKKRLAIDAWEVRRRWYDAGVVTDANACDR